MDVSSCGGNSECEDVSSCAEGLLSSFQEIPGTFFADVSVIELGNTLDRTLHIDTEDCDAKKIVEFESPEKACRSKPSHELMHKWVSFPSPTDKKVAEHRSKPNGLSSDDETSRNSYARSFSLPSPTNLVSAMKGGRAKHGAESSAKLSVNWAPDVYDPTPTTLSHTVRGGGSKRQQKSKNSRKNWKNGKKGQKGSSSSRGKDKKQPCKASGSSNNGSYRSMGGREALSEASDEYDESSSYCGSSFMKKSLANMHYPVAEAL